MFRRIALVASGTVALVAILIAPAAAKPITGNVTCTLKGSATVKPGFPFTSTDPLTKTLKTKVTFNGTLSNCTGAQVNTKKGLQIDGGSVSAKGVITTPAGQVAPNCIDISTKPPVNPLVLKTKVKFTNAGKTIATSVVQGTVGQAQANGSAVIFPTSGTVSGGNAFKGQSLEADAVLDLDIVGLAAACQATGGLTTLNFTGVQGESMLTSP